MGVLADNERLKMRATFYNNIGAGILLGGVLVPYLAFVEHAGPLTARLIGGEAFSFAEYVAAFAIILATVLAALAGRHMRHRADSIIRRIKGIMPNTPTLDDGPR